MIQNTAFTVTAEESGLRIDLIIMKRFPTIPRSFVKKGFDSSAVLLNGSVVRKGAKLKTGDNVLIVSLPEATDRHVRPDSSIIPEIVYDDGVLIGVDKPAGIPVQPLSIDETGTLMNGLVAYAPKLASVGDDPMMAGALHRIDAGTSGLVLASRSNDLWRSIRDLFAERKVLKTYIAMVEGEVSCAGKVSCDLAHDPLFPVCRMVEASKVEGKCRPMFAETFYTPIRSVGRNTLLQVTILTGVTHQIRAQLAMQGHPVCGDTLYGAKPIAKSCGHRLHALAVDFVHPETGGKLSISTKEPSWAEGVSSILPESPMKGSFIV